MKKIVFALIAFTAIFGFSSCQKADELNPESIITVDKVDYTPFDYWLDQNFVGPYNLQFKYRYEEIESDLNYYTVPADYNNAIKLAHLVKYLCLEAYDEVGGIEFTKTYFPKLIFCTGDWEYKNNGSMILGTAEGGRKIFLGGVNHLDSYLKSQDDLNTYYFKTIHHEFTHILNQTKEMPTNYQFITGTAYVADAWSTDEYKSGYFERGFVSAYSQESYTEDFAEMLSMYVCHDAQTWEGYMTSAGEEGGALIAQKLDIVKDYMLNSFSIDLDLLRATIQRRQADIMAGKIDLNDISVK